MWCTLWLWLGTAAAAPTAPSSAQEITMEPGDRVLAFAHAFEATHAAGKKAFGDDVDFDLWRDLVAELDRIHFAHRAGMELAGSFGTPPAHNAEEQIQSTEQDGDRAVVITQGQVSTLPMWFEYELVRIDGTWRIGRIAQHFDPPNAPYVPVEEQGALLDPPATPLRDPEDGVEVNGHRLFQQGRAVTMQSHETSIDVRDIGVLTTTGVLAVGDFGYSHDLMEPLTLRVPAGSYPVQTAVAFGRNAALRVRLHDTPAVAWHPADSPSGGHVVGVDAGNVTIADAAGLVALTSSSKERLYEGWAYSTDHPTVRRLDMATEGDGVICASGFGDGAYPVYWGLDDTGRPVELLVDFLVLAEWQSETVEVPIVDGKIQSPDDGLTLGLSRTGTHTELLVDASQRRPNEVILLDEAGEALVSTASSGSSQGSGGRWTYRFDDPTLADQATEVRVILPAGRRN